MLAAVEKLVNTDKVDIIVGGTNNATTMEVIPALKKYTKVTVWMGASSKKVEDALEGQDWFFHLHAWDYQLGAYYEKMWREIVQKYPAVKRKKIFAAYKEDPFGSDIYSVASPSAMAYSNVMQGEGYTGVGADGTDYRALLKKARIFGADIFIWEGSEKDAIPMLEEAKNSGFAPPVYLGAPLLWPADFGKQIGSGGVMFYGYWHDSVKRDRKSSSEYSAAFNTEFKEAPATYFGPLAYPKLIQWQRGSAKIIWPWELATGKLIYPFPAQGFAKVPPLEEAKKPPVVAPKPPAKGSKPAVPAKMKQPAPARKPKPTTSAPAAKPAATTPATPPVAPAPKPAAPTTTTPAPALGCIGTGCTEEEKKRTAPAVKRDTAPGCIGTGCTEEEKKRAVPAGK